MIYEDLIVEHNSTLMVVVVTNLKWTSFSSNDFKMNLQNWSAFQTIADLSYPKFGWAYTVKYMGETHIEYTETFTARNAHLIETKRSHIDSYLI